MLDPYARTLRGFCALVAKEWCSFGHKFGERAGHMLEKDDGDISPVFIQFLDAVCQLVRLFPRAFEFNQRLPLLLAHHLYSCRFGTFLHNNERERAEANVEIRTASLWAYVLSGGPVTESVRSNEYDPSAGDVLLPSKHTVLRSVTLWHAWFARYAPYPTSSASCSSMESYETSFYNRTALVNARLPPSLASIAAAAAGGGGGSGSRSIGGGGGASALVAPLTTGAGAVISTSDMAAATITPAATTVVEPTSISSSLPLSHEIITASTNETSAAAATIVDSHHHNSAIIMSTTTTSSLPPHDLVVDTIDDEIDEQGQAAMDADFSLGEAPPQTSSAGEGLDD